MRLGEYVKKIKATEEADMHTNKREEEISESVSVMLQNITVMSFVKLWGHRVRIWKSSRSRKRSKWTTPSTGPAPDTYCGYFRISMPLKMLELSGDSTTSTLLTNRSIQVSLEQRDCTAKLYGGLGSPLRHNTHTGYTMSPYCTEVQADG